MPRLTHSSLSLSVRATQHRSMTAVVATQSDGGVEPPTSPLRAPLSPVPPHTGPSLHCVECKCQLISVADGVVLEGNQPWCWLCYNDRSICPRCESSGQTFSAFHNQCINPNCLFMPSMEQCQNLNCGRYVMEGIRDKGLFLCRLCVAVRKATAHKQKQQKCEK